MSDVLRVALIADIHHGMDVGTKLGTAALTLLQPFIHWVNDIRPGLVVELVDCIKPLRYHWQNLDRHYAPKPTQLSSSMTSYIAKQGA
jgi:hypothetical protein